MKKSIFSLAVLGLFTLSTRAADLVVDINGAGGAYNSIQAAINAASTGDRLLITPNGVPFAENLIINKSISLLCQTEGARFSLQGGITVNSDATLPGGSVITISGMNLQSGSVSAVYSPGGTRVKVNVLNSKLSSGNILFDLNNYDLRLQDDSLMSGRIVMRYGSVTGSFLRQSDEWNTAMLTINADSQPSDDVIYIAGNTIQTSLNYHPWYSQTGLTSYTTSHYVNISNNHVITSTLNAYGIYIYYTKSSGSGQNHVTNNTFNHNATNGYYALYIIQPYTPLIIQNNVFVTGNYGIYSNGNFIANVMSYNHFNASFTVAVQNVSDNGTNTFNASNSIDSEGKVTSGSAVDGGNPDFAFWDLDNTPNDAGCFGGSWSRENFLAAAPNSRTSIVFAPRRVVSGNNVNIKAEGYDK